MSSAAQHINSPIDPIELERLRTHYEGVDDQAVQVTLTSHPETVSLLLEATAHLHAEFGAGVTLRLEPSYLDEELVFARVHRHGFDALEALDHLERFGDAWWYQQPADLGQRWIVFDLGGRA